MALAFHRMSAFLLQTSGSVAACPSSCGAGEGDRWFSWEEEDHHHSGGIIFFVAGGVEEKRERNGRGWASVEYRRERSRNLIASAWPTCVSAGLRIRHAWGGRQGRSRADGEVFTASPICRTAHFVWPHDRTPAMVVCTRRLWFCLQRPSPYSCPPSVVGGVSPYPKGNPTQGSRGRKSPTAVGSVDHRWV